MRAKARAFTLVELLVVIAIIVLLLSIMLPAMCQATEMTHRAACLGNLRQISLAATAYTIDNQGVYIICRGREVMKCFNAANMKVHRNRDDDKYVDWAAQWYSYGLVQEPWGDIGQGRQGYQPTNTWNCPSRNYKAQWESAFPQMVVAYQYMGGIEYWRNPFKGNWRGPTDRYSASPVRVGTSKSDWMLVSDIQAIVGGKWRNTDRKAAYGDLPNHKAECNSKAWAAGGNQAYVDGSAEWVNFNQMLFIHSWSSGRTNGSFARGYFFWQKDLNGWDPVADGDDDAFGSYWERDDWY